MKNMNILIQYSSQLQLTQINNNKFGRQLLKYQITLHKSFLNSIDPMKMTNNYRTGVQTARTNNKQNAQTNNPQSQNQQNKILFQSCSINSSRDSSANVNVNCPNIIQSFQQFMNSSSYSKPKQSNSNLKNDKQNRNIIKHESIDWGNSFDHESTKKYSSKSKNNNSSKGLIITANAGNLSKNNKNKIPLQQNINSTNVHMQISHQEINSFYKSKNMQTMNKSQTPSYRDYLHANNEDYSSKNASTYRGDSLNIQTKLPNQKHGSMDFIYQDKEKQKIQIIQPKIIANFEKHNQAGEHRRIISYLQESNKQLEQTVNQKYHKINKDFNIIKQKDQNNKKKSSYIQTTNQVVKLNKNSFNYESVLGKGGFGKVWKVICKKTKRIYALKQMSKALIISKKSVPSVLSEQQLLKQLFHPFLVNMSHSFQTRQNLFLVMDYLSGGDLRTNLATKKYFSQDQTKFIIICILVGLRYLHSKQVIHRDIKPENIVFDERGYARITDLGVARRLRINNSSDTSGTPGYMAPEVLCRQNHTYAADFFAVGVIAYQLMLRKRPYYGKSRKQIRDQVLSRQVQIKKNQIPDNWSLEGTDFINRLIQRKPSNRLGYKGIQQIFQHPWIANFPIQKLQQKKLNAPYIPSSSMKNRQQDDFSSQETEIKQLIVENQIMLRKKQVQNLFEGYQYQKRF